MTVKLILLPKITNLLQKDLPICIAAVQIVNPDIREGKRQTFIENSSLDLTFSERGSDFGRHRNDTSRKEAVGSSLVNDLDN